MSDHEMIAEWLEAQYRIAHQARNDRGREALAGEWMMLRSGRDPATVAKVEAFCNDLNRHWRTP
jgi:hypothetical protein